MIAVRSITENDLLQIMEWRMHPDITRYMNTDPKLTLEGQKEWLKKIQKDSTVKYWMVVIDGEEAGVLCLTDLNLQTRQASWGYYVGNKAKRSFDVAINIELSLYCYCFETLGLDTINGEVFSENKPTIKLHVICGCDIVDVKERHVEKNGNYHDVTFISINKKKWEQIKNRIPYEQIIFEERIENGK